MNTELKMEAKIGTHVEGLFLHPNTGVRVRMKGVIQRIHPLGYIFVSIQWPDTSPTIERVLDSDLKILSKPTNFSFSQFREALGVSVADLHSEFRMVSHLSSKKAKVYSVPEEFQVKVLNRKVELVDIRRWESGEEECPSWPYLAYLLQRAYLRIKSI